MNELIIDIIGYIAAGLSLVSFSMRTMKALRMMAIAANCISLVYAILSYTPPMIFLQACLLPLNLYRIFQMNKILGLMEEAASDRYDFQPLVPHMHIETRRKGETLFHKGDQSRRVYIIHRGQIYLKELDKYLKEGDILGEIGIFSKDLSRSATAIAATDLELYSLCDSTVRELYFQNPDFGIYLTKLMIQRLQANQRS